MICPSNPFISVEPILAVPGVREAVAACAAPVLAVSPIIGGRAVKGPTAKMMRELGLEVSAGDGRRRYRDLLDGYVVRRSGRGRGRRCARVPSTQLMTSLAEREALARAVLDAADAIRRERA